MKKTARAEYDKNVKFVARTTGLTKYQVRRLKRKGIEIMQFRHIIASDLSRRIKKEYVYGLDLDEDVCDQIWNMLIKNYWGVGK